MKNFIISLITVIICYILIRFITKDYGDNITTDILLLVLLFSEIYRDLNNTKEK